MGEKSPGLEEEILTEVEKEIDEPRLYRVLLHNDDYTTREFVVQVLVAVFNKSLDEATRLMWHVHRNGVGTCGLYPLEVAETKITLATAAAREHGFPLKLTLEDA